MGVPEGTGTRFGGDMLLSARIRSTGASAPAIIRGSADGGTEVAFAHIPTGPTKTKRFYIDMDESTIVLTNAVPTMATVEDERQPGTLSS